MPTEPSVMIQVFSALALRLVAISEAAPSGAGPRDLDSGDEAPGLSKFPERTTPNFFSILLAGGLKIARGEPRQGIPAPAF
jgi:hypothetical protein